MKKLQQKIFNLGMACVFIFVGMLLYRESVSEPVFIEKKYVALTYDDGPSRLTTQALVELLNKYDASATFFINGNHANENKELVKHIYENGNEIGNHTLDHVWLTKASQEERERQIYGNESLLQFLSGQQGDMLVRPPYGDIDEGQRYAITTRDGGDALGTAINLTQLDKFVKDYKLLNGRIILATDSTADTLKFVQMDNEGVTFARENGETFRMTQTEESEKD